VTVDGITIRNNYFRTNSDGIDPVSCRNVHISNCHIVAGDDCIVMKTRDGKPCENIVVSNCTLETIATAIKLGTESSGDFRNIHVRGCSVRNSTVGIGIYLKDGGTMERITFSDIDIENYTPQGITNVEKGMFPIFVDIERRHEDSAVGTLRDLAFQNVQITSGAGLTIQGMPESRIENLLLRDVTFRVTSPIDYSNRRKHVGGRRTTSDRRDTLFVRQPCYAALAHVDMLTVDNLRVLIAEDDYGEQPRSALYGYDLHSSVVRNVLRRPAIADDGVPLMTFHDCRSGTIDACLPQGQSTGAVTISGAHTADMTVVGHEGRKGS
jgi:hypothetical protein